MEPWVAAKIIFKLVWRCHHLLSGFLANVHLLRVSRKSRLSTNDKGDNEMIPGVVHRTPGIHCKAEENPGNPQLGDRLMKIVRPVSSLQMELVGSYSTSGREKEGRDPPRSFD